MTQQYTQSIEVDVPRTRRAYQWTGIAFVLFSVGFLLMGIFLSPYAFIGFALFLALGAVNLHIFNASAREYFFSLSERRVVLAKKDVLNKTTRMADIQLSDVVGFCEFEDVMDDENDILLSNDPYVEGVYALSFKEGERLRRVLFAPDPYMLELLNLRLKGIEGRDERGA